MDLRQATQDDAQILFLWRNDPETRSHSRNTKEISWENHLSWLKQTLSMTTRKLYLAEHKGELVGSVRSDKNDDGTVELSWIMAPSHRGKGLSKVMVKQFANHYHPKEKLIAVIQKGNLPSEKIAQALGLHPRDVENQDAGQLFIVWHSNEKTA
jgi:RimJ/RimL family protein N-acetyltransferase